MKVEEVELNNGQREVPVGLESLKRYHLRLMGTTHLFYVPYFDGILSVAIVIIRQ